MYDLLGLIESLRMDCEAMGGLAQSPESKELELLHGLVRCWHPHLIMESGAYYGCSTIIMAHALMENGSGSIITCELDAGNIPQLNANLIKYGYPDIVKIYNCSGRALPDISGSNGWHFAFLDSDHSYENISAEMEIYYRGLSHNGLLVLHDANSDNSIDVNGDGVAKLFNELPYNKIRTLTRNGLGIIQKT